MKWAIVFGIVFVFFIAPAMFRSCSEAEFERARNRMHHDLQSHRGVPVNPQAPRTEDDW